MTDPIIHRPAPNSNRISSADRFQKQGYTFTTNVTILIFIAASLAFFRFFGKAESSQPGVPGWRLAQES